MRILMASSEVGPFARTGGLGDVLGSLPKALALRGHEVTIFTPFYRQTREYLERFPQKLKRLPAITFSWSGWTARAELLRGKLPGSEVEVIFVGNDELFDRSAIYAPGPEGDDHLERFTFFCRAVVAGCSRLGLQFDIVHAHDWHAALLPVYLRSEFGQTSSLAGAASVYTIHNLSYQGQYGSERFLYLGLSRDFLSVDGLEYYGDINLMKGGIIFADQVTTVSPTYAREIQTAEEGAGLDGVLRALTHKVSGILNGIDIEEWDPVADPVIAANYSVEDLSGKERCVRNLREVAGLRRRTGAPVIGGISRLVEQKGFDLLIPVISRLVRLGMQVVILGSGEPQLEEALAQAEERHPGDVRSFIQFDPDLAHVITAGSNLLVMPSRYEPCGLNQMYALRYGTLPVVRMTGGLADTVIPFDGTNQDAATGFGFYPPISEELQREMFLARVIFREPETWRQLQRNGMQLDFSWDASAREYEQVYARAMQAMP